jgi:hypothetical protein
MCRPLLRRLPVLLTVALAVGLRAAAADDDPLDGKPRARQLRQAHQVQPRELAQARYDAARSACELRRQRLRGGTDLTDTVLDALATLRDAELGLANSPAERLAARERYWVEVREVEELTRERVENGVKNFTPADYWLARGERLLAELRLLQELSEARTALSGALPVAFDDPDPLATKALACEEAKVTRKTAQALVRAARDAIVAEYEVRTQRVRGGTDTPDVLGTIPLRRVKIEQAGGADPVDLMAALESLWQMAWYLDVLTRERVEWGVKMFTPADSYEAHGLRLESAVWLADARQRRGGTTLPLRGALQDPLSAVDDPLSAKDVARAKFADTRAGRRQLEEEQREMLLAAYGQRIQRVRSGTDTPEWTLAVSRHLLDAELALATDRGQRRAAVKRHWARAAEIEELVLERIDTGSINFTPTAYWHSRCERLRAELQLVEGRAARD